MPIDLSWLEPQRVLQATLTPTLTLDDASTLHQQLAVLLETLPEDEESRAHYVVDARALQQLPSKNLLQQVVYFKHEGLDWTIFISEQGNFRTRLMNAQLGLIKAHFKQVPHWEAARAALQAIDPTLPEINEP